jgi:transcriptional antiterminator RfaH
MGISKSIPRLAEMSFIAFPPRNGRESRPGDDGAKLTMNTIPAEPIHGPLDIWRETNWFAIHVKPRREGFASMNVGALGIQILFPRVKAERLVRGAAQQRIKPLFPGYFFARFCPENSFELVKATPGVLQVVSSGRIPIPVPEGVVQEIQDRIQEDGLIQIRPQSFAPGTLVKIQSGPFEGMMGRVERELDDKRRVAIFLKTLFNAHVLIERRWLEAEAA